MKDFSNRSAFFAAKSDRPGKSHPLMEELAHGLATGGITRREFLRYTALLGLSSAFFGTTRASTAYASAGRGGLLRVAAPVQKVDHPARLAWVSPSNQIRQVAEYLTFTDQRNITHPYLLDHWEVSFDLTTWRLTLRNDLRFNNGDECTADDVIFSMRQWLDPEIDSSMRGILGDYLSPSGIEKTGRYQVTLHLDRPEIALPEHLFHYPAVILNHRTFEGDFLKRPHGTGPYVLAELSPGERCVLKRRPDYRIKGPDGKPLPYLDEIRFIDMGSDIIPQIEALGKGLVDIVDLGDSGGSEVYEATRDLSDVTLASVAAAHARVLRMRVDRAPWSDNRVRSAMKLCQHRQNILDQAYFGQGFIGQDFHVHPHHPEYCEQIPPGYDPEKARQLLGQAGYPQGLDVELIFGEGWKDVLTYAEILKRDAAPAGFRIRLHPITNREYRKQWMDIDFGITPWVHRPLGTMVLNLAYSSDKDGKPVPWNETRWTDPEFSRLLAAANTTIDPAERKKMFCKLEKIQKDRGSVGISYWRNAWMVAGKGVCGLSPHPSLYLFLDRVWKEPVQES